MGPESPYFPVEMTPHHAGAVQALMRGDCPEHQQREFMRWLIEDVCGTYDQSYRPEPHDTSFAEGKRFVGNTIVKASKIDPKKLAENIQKVEQQRRR